MPNNAGQIKVLSRNELPERLLEISDPPESLHILGELPKGGFNLCVVGSRRPTPYGIESVKTLIGGLRGHPINIISGLALGIDTLSHAEALKNNLKTVAVPGSGLGDSVLYPSSNKMLARKILENGGALISEFPDDFKATPWSFPQRNRIMAGISDAVLLIEAEIKSGTLITARLATDYNRDVLVVPGSIFSANSKGTNFFLKLGATPITESADILKHFGIQDLASKEEEDNLSDDEKIVMRACKNPVEINVLFEALDLPAQRINAAVTLLEIKGNLRKNGNLLIPSK